ncbi:heat-inducible transcriptional repressor HrcA [Steroidobacter sp. S1-65]|uniref:Heat-inducible transcription repressor HrcA n=1 Tax=Steroidobacter gossypii TaxID=2805490 RepID=A0ABS1WW88_9GAMM|nr:heat-inducible transcriptional repressor HrcA [Steroidobacter gossypii]MBM0105212.1 heat-inducible transcriptional repressor HrcA [Steroidobacter gossypii]
MHTQTHDETLNERSQQLLRLLVEHYIRDGQPVGSRTLSRDMGLNLSAATIRNVMADLEELGFVTSPHTSAGRVPTDKGYRFFVDTLLKYEPLDDEKIAAIQSRFGEHGADHKALVAAASQMLSSVTRLAGVVTLPRQSHSSLSQIEFVPLSDNRVLAVMVVNGREVQNRIVQLDRHYSGEELRRASNYLNQEFGGKELSAVREHLLSRMKETRESLNQVMLDAIHLAQHVVMPQSSGGSRMEYVIAGETNLMNFAELSNVEKLRRLFEAFTQQRDILHLLDQSLKAEGVQIFIGQESGYTILDDCSVVTAPYTLDQEVVGVLGVIGPTRMAYERIIPIVDITAKLLGSALNSRS